MHVKFAASLDLKWYMVEEKKPLVFKFICTGIVHVAMVQGRVFLYFYEFGRILKP